MLPMYDCIPYGRFGMTNDMQCSFLLSQANMYYWFEVAKMINRPSRPTTTVILHNIFSSQLGNSCLMKSI